MSTLPHLLSYVNSPPERNKVPLSLDTCSNDVPSLGLLIIAEQLDYINFMIHTLFFSHIPEISSSFLLSKVKRKRKKREQNKIIKLYAGEKHKQMVWNFYCGIVKSEDRNS